MKSLTRIVSFGWVIDCLMEMIYSIFEDTGKGTDVCKYRRLPVVLAWHGEGVFTFSFCGLLSDDAYGLFVTVIFGPPF